jgi:hypothetical protein
MSLLSESSVKEITEKLIIIAGLKKGEKLSINSNKTDFKVQASWFFQGILRFNDKREDTIDFLEILYNKAVGECERLSTSESLIIVGIQGKTYMTTLENKHYLQNKELLDRLCLRIEKSIVGLKSLSETYTDEPVFVSLIDQSQHCVKITRKFLIDTETSYRKMRILSSPLEIIEDGKHNASATTSALVMTTNNNNNNIITNEEKKTMITTATTPLLVTPTNVSPAFTTTTGGGNNNLSSSYSPASSAWSSKPNINK